jgi:fucose 4-O-acetylase-like acetyltransferase
MNAPKSLINKDLRIDTLRGLACIFLVLFHIIGAGSQSGLKIEDGLIRNMNDLLGYVRMPLFTFLSGFVYAIRPFSSDSGAFIKGKMRRLLLPMLIVGTLYAVIQSLVPGTNRGVDDWSMLHILPVAHFWFVEALFIIFIAVMLLEKINAFATPLSTAVVLAVACALFLSPLNTRYFAGSGAIYLLPYFLAGMYINRFTITGSRAVGAVLLAAVAVALYIKYPQFNASKYNRDFFELLVGITACLSLYFIGFKHLALSKLGQYSYAIYIFHVFFTAACRIVLYRLGIHDDTVVICLSLIGGLVGPVIIALIVDKNSYSRTLLLGKRFDKKIPTARVF